MNNDDWIFYHNPRCTKSRLALELLDEHDIAPKIVLYLKNPPTVAELARLCKLLGVKPTELLRTHEPLCNELEAHKLSGNALLKTIAEHPELLKRPIAIRGRRAILGIPPEAVLQLLTD